MTWTERYLAAALRSIPESNRGDVERELRSSIEDGIEERLAAGEDPATAERAVLEGLGDPSKLAASYSGRPNFLIGPELFPLWRSTMVRLVATAAPIAMVVVGALELVDSGGQFADAILAAASAAINVPVQILFWGTIAFAFLDRAESARTMRADLLSKGGPWTLEHLPEVAPKRISAGEVAGELVTVLITAGAIAFLRTLTVPGVNGANELLGGPFTGGLFLVVVVALIARAALQVYAYAAGRWTTYMATIHAALHLLFGVPIIWLALEGTLINPYFAAGIGWPELADPNGWPTLGIAIGTSIGTGFEILRGCVRAGSLPSLGSMLRLSRHSA